MLESKTLGPHREMNSPKTGAQHVVVVVVIVLVFVLLLKHQGGASIDGILERAATATRAFA